MFNWKKGVALMSVVAGVVLLSACNWFLSDNQILQKMFERGVAIESGNIDGQVSLLISNEMADTELVLKMKGQYAMENLKDLEQLKYVYDYNLAFSASLAGMTFAGNADFIQTESKMFFKLNSFPMMMFLEEGDNYLKQWYHLDFQNLMDLSSEDSEYSRFSNMKNLNSLIGDLNTVMIDQKFLSVKKDLGKINLGNYQVYHYILELNKDEFKNVFAKLMDSILASFAEDEMPEIGLEEKQELFSMVNTFIDNLNIKNIEAYIDTKTFDLRKILIELEFENRASLPGLNLDGEDLVTNTIGVIIDFSMDKFNEIKISDIELPSESQDLYQQYMEVKSQELDLLDN